MSSYDSLEQALVASHLAAAQTYEAGRESLGECQAAIEATRDDLSAIIAELEGMDAEASEAIDALEEQFLAVGDRLETDFRARVATFETFYTQLERFSVTLFGRTMSGKSTLMEILTEGDGASIGKGAQRTTRDIRTYQWKNLEITDVPGIAAFGGKADEQVAYEAARRADVILFLITDDAPQPVEAEHLARVIALGKPVIGLCNVKMAVERERDFKRFKMRHQKLFDAERIGSIVAQFHAMLREYVPDAEVEFFPIHLHARFLANSPDHEARRDTLGELSRFAAFEDRLLQEVVERGPMIRTRTLGDAAVVPLLEMTQMLFGFSRDNTRVAQLFSDKLAQLQSWRAKNKTSSEAKLTEAVGRRVDELRTQVPGFVEEFLEDKKIDKEWKRLLKQVNLESAVEAAQREIAAETKSQMEAFGKELEREIELLSREFESMDLDAASIIDTRRIASWAIIGVSLGVALVSVFAVAAAPMLVGTGFALAVGGSEILFKLFTKSREEKLKKHREELTQQLLEHLDALENDALTALDDWYANNIEADLILPFISNLRVVTSTLERLSIAQRELAITLLEELKVVNYQILTRALSELDAPAIDATNAINELSKDNFARVPGLESALLIESENQAIIEAQLNLERMLDTPLRIVMATDDPRSLIKQTIGAECKHVEIDADARRAQVTCSAPSPRTDTRLNLAQQLTGLQIVYRAD